MVAERPFTQELEVDVDELQQVICCQSRQRAKVNRSCILPREQRQVWLCGCEGVQVCLGCAVKTAKQSSCKLET